MAGYEVTANSTATTIFVWDAWNNGLTTNNAWQYWTATKSGTTATTCNTITADVWCDWNGQLTYTLQQVPAESDAEREARLARIRQYEENKRDAETRAKALLEESLSEKQREEMEKERYFTVESKDSKRRYRVRTDKGRHGNIEELDEQGRAVATLCCAPQGAIPLGDALLGQKLALEADEEMFRKAANRTALRVA